MGRSSFGGVKQADCPRVTVVVPTYQRAHWLGGAIESVLAQSWPAFRLVVSDNASTDATPGIVARFDDPRLKYVRRDRNVDLNTHFNLCMAEVDTECVLVLPDDDRLTPDALARTMSVLDAHPRVGMVHGQADVIDRDGGVIVAGHAMTGFDDDTVESGGDFIARTMDGSFRVHASTALIRTAAAADLRFEQQDFPATDLAYWLRLAAEWDIAFIATPLAKYRIHENTYSAGTSTVTTGGYVQGVERIVNIRDVKLRFLAGRADSAALRARAHRAFRRDLIAHAAEATYRNRALVPTTRAVASCTRLDARVALEPSAWRLLGTAVLGRRLVTTLKRRAAGVTA